MAPYSYRHPKAMAVAEPASSSQTTTQTAATGSKTAPIANSAQQAQLQRPESALAVASATPTLAVLAAQQQLQAQSQGPSEEEQQRAAERDEVMRQLEGKKELIEALKGYEASLQGALAAALQAGRKGKNLAQVEFKDFSLDPGGNVFVVPDPNRFNDTSDALSAFFTSGRETHSVWAIINEQHATQMQIMGVQAEIAALEMRIHELSSPDASDQDATLRLLTMLLGAEPG